MDSELIAKLNRMCPAAARAQLGTQIQDALEVAAGEVASALENVVDDATLEVSDGTLQVKDAGIDETKLAETVVYRLPLTLLVSGDITDSIAATAIGFAHGAGRVVKAGFRLGNTGADGTDPLALEGDVLIDGVSVFSTKPKLTKDAADGASTFVAGDGVTVGVIDTNADDVGANSVISFSGTLTRSTPEDEMADLLVYVEIEYTVST